MIVATHYEQPTKLGWSVNSDVISAKITTDPTSSKPLLVKIKQFNPVKFFNSNALILDDDKSEKELLECLPREHVQKVRELFLQSGERLVKLKHDNLTAVLGVYLPDDSIHYGVVMEYFKGETLQKLLQTEEGRLLLSKIPLKTRLQWIRQIADALQFLHQNGLVHHNLKQSNLVIDLETMTVKITDFFAECFMRPAEIEAEERKNNKQKEEEDGEDEEEENDEEEEEEEEEVDEAEEAKELEKQRKLDLSKLADFQSPPELLMEMGFTEASDIYCYTILLWQILCCEIPFPEVKDKREFQTQIVKQHLRPSVDKIKACLPSNNASDDFLDKVQQGWILMPSQRTSLEEYIQSIDALLKRFDINHEKYPN